MIFYPFGKSYSFLLQFPSIDFLIFSQKSKILCAPDLFPSKSSAVARETNGASLEANLTLT